MNDQVSCNSAAVEYLELAVKAGQSLYFSAMEAARIAAAELDLTLPVTESVNQVRDRYHEHFGSNSNVRSNFTDGLVLAYAAAVKNEGITIEEGKGDDKTEFHTTPAETLAEIAEGNMPREKAQKLTRATRENLGIARKSGGGRKGAQNTNVEVAAQMVSFQSMLDTMLKTPENVASFKEMLKQRGYQLRKLAS